MTCDKKNVAQNSLSIIHWDNSNKHVKRILWVVILLICFTTAFFYYYNFNFHYTSWTTVHPLIKGNVLIEEKPDKIILFWTTFFGSKNFIPDGINPFKNSSDQQHCQTTADRSMLNQSDAVMFHIPDLHMTDLPSHRLPHQRWIFYLYESPRTTHLNLKDLPDFFNWTMTYRRDSDIYIPYSSYQGMKLPGNWSHQFIQDTSNNNNQTDILQNFVRRKRKLVAWFVSNCSPQDGRDRYATELQKYIQLDIYGKCGPLVCENTRQTRQQCYDMLEQDYKFYLSFENAVCVDYVTEKFYNAFLFNMVPIVYGGADYTKLAPNMSYIDVRDFDSPKELAEYLQQLDSNEEEYMRYFEWRRNPQLKDDFFPSQKKSWCTLCEMLHNDSIPNHSYRNIHSWWMDGGNCGTENLFKKSNQSV